MEVRDIAVSMLVDLPHWIDTEMHEAHMQQRQLANRLGVHPRTVSCWIRGVTQPNAEMLLRMIMVFGYRISEE